MAPRAPELVTDASALEAFRGGRWSDEHDSTAMHRVVRDETGGELLAAARLGVHERLADVPAPPGAASSYARPRRP